MPPGEWTASCSSTRESTIPESRLLSLPDALPAVVVGDSALAGDLPSVWTDDDGATRESLRYLHALGHRRVARIAGREEFGRTHIRDRAFDDEAEKLGIEGATVRTDYMPESGAAATRRMLTSGRPPTAVVYDNDVMALAGLAVAAELGVAVPAELSIIAWDDSSLCQATFPRLTALSHDVVSYGAHVARRLFDRIDGVVGGSFRDSTPTLKPRGTTARAPRSSRGS